MQEDRENVYYLSETVRNTMKILTVLNETQTIPVTAFDLSELTGLPPEFCLEALITLAFDEYVLETDSGFLQVGLELPKIKPHTRQILVRSFDDRGAPPPRVRRPSGEWEE